jgi:CheY-like chemotaxis protein
MQVRILIVDDDEVSRDVLTRLAEDAGYEAEGSATGDAALLHLQGASRIPDVVLCDIQMPGTSGSALARRLRDVCGAKTILLAMSGSSPENGEEVEFDGFLLKPFSMSALAAAIAGDTSGGEAAWEGANGVDLNERIYRKLEESMRRPQLEHLYALCLKDAEERVEKMRQATSEGDATTYRKEAHALKGGCAMVGAVELQRLAASMEQRGLCDDKVATLDEFVAACERLRRILVECDSNYRRVNESLGERA